MSFLRRLDDRLLPRLGNGLRRFTRPRGHGVAAGSRRRRLGGAALLVLLGLIGAATLGSSPGRTEPSPGGDISRVGAADGTRVAAYVARSRAELDALPVGGARPTFALVSLRGYGTPAQVATLLSAVPVVRGYLRVPLAGVQTEIVAVPVITPLRDLEAGMRRVADREDRAAGDDERSAAKLLGPSRREQELRAFYTRSAQLLRAQARYYRRLCPCLYAVVVKAAPGQLKQLATRPAVRAVDPAPELGSLESAVFLPLLPEQTSVVSPPSDAGLPALPAAAG